MHAHNNTWLVKTELFLVLLGIPLCGVIWASVLWRRSRRAADCDDPQYVLLGLRSTAYAFVGYLVWLGLSSLPRHYSSGFSALLLILLSMTSTIAAGAGLVLTLLRARGSTRIYGTMLALLALLYTVASGLALLAGGGGPG